MSDLLDLYQTIILEHSRHPHHRGRLAGEGVFSAEGDNPLCGDHVTLDVRIDDGVVVDAAFDGDGCAISLASASMLCDAVVGRTVEAAGDLFDAVHAAVAGPAGDAGGELPADVAEALGPLAALGGVRRFPMRVKCATLAWHTLRRALAEAGR